MGRCVKCGKKGLFLKVSSEGLCGDCFRKTQGLLGTYDLYDWWENELTQEERNFIEASYSVSWGVSTSSSDNRNSLTSGYWAHNHSKFDFITTNLLGRFGTSSGYHIAKKIIKLADSMINEATVLEKHFYFLHKIQLFYSNRDNFPDAFDLAINACEDQIAISREAKTAFQNDPVFSNQHNDSGKTEHTGFKRLCIIYEQKGKWGEVVRLSQMAKEQDFWEGDWDKRIEKAQKKLVTRSAE
jgi:hypothetical protein